MQNKKVEIVLVKFGADDYERQSIKSIEENTSYKPYKLTVIDNYEDNFRLAKIWNDIIRKSDCPYICIINNDVITPKSWLKKMVNALEKEDNIGAVGVSSNRVGGRQIVAWRDVSDKFKPFPDDENVDLDYVEKLSDYFSRYFVEQKEELPELSGFCYVLKRDVWKEIGGFNELGYRLYGSDNEFILRMTRMGYKAVWHKDIFVFHYKAISTFREMDKGSLDREWEIQAALSVYNMIRNDNYLNGNASIPILMLVKDRLTYTKEAIETLYKNTKLPFILYLFNNASDMETTKYLRQLNDKKENIVLEESNFNLGVDVPIARMYEKFKKYPLFAKVDNDTLVKKGWLKSLKKKLLKYDLDVIGSSHYTRCPEALKKIERAMIKSVEPHTHVGGSGILIRSYFLNGFRDYQHSRYGGNYMGAWTGWQNIRVATGCRIAFVEDWIHLLDMKRHLEKKEKEVKKMAIEKIKCVYRLGYYGDCDFKMDEVKTIGRDISKEEARMLLHTFPNWFEEIKSMPMSAPSDKMVKPQEIEKKNIKPKKKKRRKSRKVKIGR